MKSTSTMAAANESFDSSSVYEANLVTVLPEDVIEKLAELDLELSEGKESLLYRKLVPLGSCYVSPCWYYRSTLTQVSY